MCVTPRVMFSWFQPDSAYTGSAPAPAASANTREASFSRIIFNVPCSAPLHPGARFLRKPTRCRAPPLAPGGRLVHAANEALQPQRQSASLLFCEEAAQLALAAVRLDGEPARVQACCGAAQFNLRPMPRKHDMLASVARSCIDADIRVGQRDGLTVEAPLEAHAECPAEERHLEARERQNGPESLERENKGDAARHDTGGTEEQPCPARTERAVRADLDAQRLGFHARSMVAPGALYSSHFRSLSHAARAPARPR